MYGGFSPKQLGSGQAQNVAQFAEGEPALLELFCHLSKTLVSFDSFDELAELFKCTLLGLSPWRWHPALSSLHGLPAALIELKVREGKGI